MSGFRPISFAWSAARWLVLWGLIALLFWAFSALLPGIHVPSFEAGLLATGLIALLNALLWPLLIRVLLPLTVLTFGLGSLVLNAAIVSISIQLVDGDAPDFLGALLLAFVLSVGLMVLAPALSIDDDARQLRVVRRRARKVREPTDVPGVIMFEIDGLAEAVLRSAIRQGHAPTMTRWLDQGSHRVVPWECDLSSQTGASQAGLLLGSNEDMPAFRWYEKESGRTMVSNHGKDAVELERRHSDGGGLLAAGGASRGNMFSGDAPHCSATMSVLRDRRRSSAREYFAYFADPYGFTRTIALYVWDVLLEVRAARRQRRRGEEHIDRGGLYPFMRGAITVVMRDLNVATLLGDIVEGLPVIYSTFVGYDEVAHHSGIQEPDAFAVLKQHDAQLARLEKALEQAPRPYHLVVLSDHGQSQGRPFRQRYGLELEGLVRDALSGGDVYAPPALDEGLSSVGGALTDARGEDTAGGRMLARATRDRVIDGEVMLGPNREAVEQAERSGSGHEAVVLASGGLGLISFPTPGHRLSLEEIEGMHPGLIQGLAGHAGIGFVMVRSESDGALVLGGEGTRRLSDDRVTGEDPLLVFGPNAADHLRRTDGFPHCPDILVNCMYDPETNEVAPFEEFMGSHGGLGGWQSHPFAMVPAAWSEPEGEIVGVRAMHEHLRRWLAETGLELRPHPTGPVRSSGDRH
ncbi:MAG TPA: phage holin family protein [Solirubrobacterales bacterium]|nr:phage holin family protein [Solirubrobacterales bacterium]